VKDGRLIGCKALRRQEIACVGRTHPQGHFVRLRFAKTDGDNAVGKRACRLTRRLIGIAGSAMTIKKPEHHPSPS
jgi:hypothetical protein